MISKDTNYGHATIVNAAAAVAIERGCHVPIDMWKINLFQLHFVWRQMSLSSVDMSSARMRVFVNLSMHHVFLGDLSFSAKQIERSFSVFICHWQFLNPSYFHKCLAWFLLHTPKRKCMTCEIFTHKKGKRIISENSIWMHNKHVSCDEKKGWVGGGRTAEM